MIRGERRYRDNLIARKRSRFFARHCYGGAWHKVIGRFRKSNGSCSCYMCRSPRKREASKKETMKFKYYAKNLDSDIQKIVNDNWDSL